MTTEKSNEDVDISFDSQETKVFESIPVFVGTSDSTNTDKSNESIFGDEDFDISFDSQETKVFDSTPAESLLISLPV